jgi:divalent metal cation (Fe/Co/Zn/Cd) transporter
MKVAKETKSQALEADALHFTSDILSSGVVLIGLVLVAFGIKSADSYAAIGVSFFVAQAGFQLGKRTIDVLTDAAPAGLREKIIELTRMVEGVAGIEKVRVRIVGPDTFVDMNVYVSRKLALPKAHAVTNSIIERIQAVFQGADVTVHLKPLTLDNESVAERVKIVAAASDLQIYDIVVHASDTNNRLSYNLELPENYSLERSHELATDLEKSLKEEIGEDYSIQTHFVPFASSSVDEKALAAPDASEMKISIEKLARQVDGIRNVHRILVRKVGSKVSIFVHCVLDGDISLKKAHETSAAFQALIEKSIPHFGQIYIHLEPYHVDGGECHEGEKKEK